jgi:deoxyribose-phosphate aldolase
LHVALRSRTGFPSGQYPLRTKLEEVRRVVSDGADEVDMVIDRGAFLAGDHAKVFDEIAATKEACGPAHLKVILETGELVTYDNVRLASEIAMQAGGDFIKTSTGKVTPPRRSRHARDVGSHSRLLFCHRHPHRHEARRRHPHFEAGARLSRDGKETLGDDWLTPDRFRFGASTLVNDVLMQIAKTVDGNYQGPDYFSLP